MTPAGKLSGGKKAINCYHANIGACNGCDLEVFNLLSSCLQKKKHLDIKLVRSVKSADILLVSGSLSRSVLKKIKDLKESISGSKTIIAIGTCAIDGGPWRNSFNVVGGIDKALNVNFFVPGCPPTPDAILQGIELALGVKKKQFSSHIYKEK
jgi:Ni,Fe-hydrogenase III small subunit